MRVLALIAVLFASPLPPLRVVYYECFVNDFTEVLCRDPVTKGLFRPERRFDRFVIVAPAL